MRSLVAVGCILAAGCSSTPPAFTPCTADTDCSGGRCLDKKCFAKTCGTKTCATGQVCVDSACADELCANKTCDPGTACAKGDCLPTSCNGVNCPAGSVCSSNACVDATCVGVLCPSGQTCQAGACVGGQTCGGTTCTNGLVCDTGTMSCVESACVGVHCDGGSCVGGQCTTVTCGGITCSGGLTCDTGTMTCVEPACVGVHCDAGTCMNGQCIGPACGGASCDGGTICDDPVQQCVEPACVGVRCDGGVCSGGACVDQCTLSCASPCPQCTTGRTCAMDFECQSHLCSAHVCTVCDNVTNTCPNGGLCQAGICRSGVDGPCNSTLDCKPAVSLTCENGQCRYMAGATCSSDMQCISTLACENLLCQQPKCILAAVQSAVVPSYEVIYEAQAFSESAQGEVYVTHAAGYSGGGPMVFRRFRVEFADAGVIEQDPTMPPLLQFDVSEPNPIGHSDSPGSAQGTYPQQTNQYFWWYQAGGAFDGVKTLTIAFTGFDNDVSGNLNNGGRFAKCGDSFYFLANALGSPRVVLRYTTPNHLGSGSMGQTMTQHSARRDSWPLIYSTDIGCTANHVYVLGADTAGGPVELALLDPMTLQTQVVWQLHTLETTSSLGDWTLAVVNDYLQFANSYAHAYQVVDGGSLTLSGIGSAKSLVGAHDDTGFSAYQGAAPNSTSGTVTWYRRQRMNGTVPPLTLQCNYQ